MLIDRISALRWDFGTMLMTLCSRGGLKLGKIGVTDRWKYANGLQAKA